MLGAPLGYRRDVGRLLSGGGESVQDFSIFLRHTSSFCKNLTPFRIYAAKVPLHIGEIGFHISLQQV